MSQKRSAHCFEKNRGNSAQPEAPHDDDDGPVGAASRSPSPPSPSGREVLVDFSPRFKKAGLHTGPSRDTPTIDDVPRGATVLLLGRRLPDQGIDPGNGYEVSYSGKTGWLHQNSLVGE